MTSSLSQQSAAIIQAKAPQFKPKIAIILGSGLGELAAKIKSPLEIPYSDLPGFSASTVQGHASQIVLGMLQNYPVICLQGRVHLYEGISPSVILTMMETLQLLGCEKILITGAVGSLRAEIQPGSLMCLNDQINLQFNNPLITKGHRGFISMENAYDPLLRVRMLEMAAELGISLTEGVYVGVLGPCFETPAEIRAYRILGADCIGMSVVNEVIAARYCGLKVVALAAITNMAAGLSTEKLSHELTLRGAKQASEDMTALIEKFIASLQQ